MEQQNQNPTIICKKIQKIITIQPNSSFNSQKQSILLKKQQLTQRKQEKIKIEYIISPRQEKIILPKSIPKTASNQESLKCEQSRCQNYQSQQSFQAKKEISVVKKLREIKNFIKKQFSNLRLPPKIQIPIQQKNQLTAILKLKQQVKPIPKEIKQFIKQSISHHQKQIEQKQKKDIEEKQNKKYLKMFVKIKDQQIRIQNKSKFCSISQESKLPWGFNRSNYIYNLQKEDYIGQKTYKRSISEVERRKRIGADFLNVLKQKHLKKKINKQKTQLLQEIIGQPIQVENFQIYLTDKIKEQVETQTKLQQQIKIQQNLQRLQQDISKIKLRQKKISQQQEYNNNKKIQKQSKKKKPLKNRNLSCKNENYRQKVNKYFDKNQILEQSAIKIQKVWKGYQTRRVIQYFINKIIFITMVLKRRK